MPPTRLARKLRTADAVVIGLGSMIGAGIFAALAPAADAAGAWLLVALAIAGFVAYCNATSSAALAALYPESGGTYAYGRKRLSPFAGFVAGYGFVVGKLASCAAMALTFGHYAAPAFARPLAMAAVVALTAINLHGIVKTAGATRIVVAIVLACLAFVVLATTFGGTADFARAIPEAPLNGYGVLQAAGILFFAFAGYARIATLGEEVADPARTIPRAIPLALGIAFAVYAVVAACALSAVGAASLAASVAPLATAVEQGQWAALSPVVRVGAMVASLGVLLSLLAGVSRTAFAMAANGDLPRVLAAVHPRRRIPHRAELTAGAVTVAIVAIADVRDAIGFSSFAVLVYYAIANASALTLSAHERRWPRALAAAGFAGCAVVALALPLHAVAAGSAVLGAGIVLYALRNGRIHSGSDR
ncbi:MAG TPA: APC family permease [Casimicrobiaceae bacterium]|nr:APC family permease [Casimicrobiaceae bacterium]